MDNMDNMETMESMEQPKQADNGFTPITSQEEFDERIKKRLKHQKSKLEREYQTQLDAAIASATSEELEALKARVAEQEELLTLAAEENKSLKEAQRESDIRDLKRYHIQRLGLSADLIDNITGTTAEEIERSAETLANAIPRFVPPQYNNEMLGSADAPYPKKTWAERIEGSYRELSRSISDTFRNEEI